MGTGTVERQGIRGPLVLRNTEAHDLEVLSYGSALMFRSIRSYGTLHGKYLRPYWFFLLLLAVLLFTNTVLQIVAPQIVRHFIDTADSGGRCDHSTSAQWLS